MYHTGEVLGCQVKFLATEVTEIIKPRIVTDIFTATTERHENFRHGLTLIYTDFLGHRGHREHREIINNQIDRMGREGVRLSAAECLAHTTRLAKFGVDR